MAAKDEGVNTLAGSQQQILTKLLFAELPRETVLKVLNTG
jgi:hypothetical protein